MVALLPDLHIVTNISNLNALRLKREKPGLATCDHLILISHPLIISIVKQSCKHDQCFIHLITNCDFVEEEQKIVFQCLKVCKFKKTIILQLFELVEFMY